MINYKSTFADAYLIIIMPYICIAGQNFTSLSYTAFFFKSQSKSRSQTRKILTFLLDSWGNWGSSKLNELPKVTQVGLLSGSPGISPLLLVFHLQHLSGGGMHAVAVCERAVLQVPCFLSLILSPTIHSLHDKDKRPLFFYGEQKTTVSKYPWRPDLIAWFLCFCGFLIQQHIYNLE